ncbi:uncharacterized protein LOC121978226 [Zingiber officinale]|uniref:uncharacterized protein LOC121978226 n=1 Tax=Zingiber officinale TaxID=94328 RepID=UPI001C4B41AE|nr:uncharacterized protein LOC121978226 [Zingiber officinale]
MKGVLRFRKKGKLSPRYIGPFEILDRIGTRAYRVALPPNLSGVHNVFHVSMLRRYISNPSHVIGHESMQWTSDQTYEERPKQILERQVRKLRNKEIKMVKILWGNQQMEEATWETERDMRDRYPDLFGIKSPNLRITRYPTVQPPSPHAPSTLGGATSSAVEAEGDAGFGSRSPP